MQQGDYIAIQSDATDYSQSAGLGCVQYPSTPNLHLSLTSQNGVMLNFM